MEILVERVYTAIDRKGGKRILVDGLWPRGIAKATLDGVPWLKAIAPSGGLRTWFGHRPARWDEFRCRYFAELDANPEAVAELRRLVGRGRVTLLYGARDEAHNNAVALREYLLAHAAERAKAY